MPRTDSLTQCVILAGGLGTRVRTETGDAPKALLDIRGVPFLKYQLLWLSQQNVTQVLLLTGYHSTMIQDYVERESPWPLAVTVIPDGAELRGTGGALRRAADSLHDRFLLTYGDSFLPIRLDDVRKAWAKGTKPALMTVMKNEGQWDKSNVDFAEETVLSYDKQHGEHAGHPYRYIDYGLAALTRDIVVERIPEGVTFDLANFYRDLSRSGELAGFEVHERFYEIGSIQGIRDFETFAETGLKNRLLTTPTRSRDLK